jgi:hypothetical protein
MDSSHFLDNKEQGLNASRLNDNLVTEFIDVPEDDDSFRANVTRTIADFVGRILQPRQILAILRVLKAVSFCFLIMILFANAMYIIFLQVLATDEVRAVAGGTRDTVIRVYGLAISTLAICIEINIHSVVKRFSGLKGFIPRSFLMLFIAMITSSHPTVENDSSSSSSSSSSNNGYGYNGGYNNNNDAYAYNGNDDTTSIDLSTEYPSSAVNFQMVVSLAL